MVTDLLAAVVAVGLLVALVIGTVSYVKAARFDTRLVIAPFYVIGLDDPDGRLGRTLAFMLHGRLRKLEQEFHASQENLATAHSSLPEEELDARSLRLPRFDVQPITMSTISTDSVKVDVKVAGIEVGSLGAWLERRAVRRRALIFAVHFGEHGALVNASLDRWPELGITDLWLPTGPEPGEMVTDLAYALLQGRMAAGGKVPHVGALELHEFRALLTSLTAIAELNRRIASGRAQSGADFARVLDSLSSVLDKVPDWPELVHLMAQLAERTGDTSGALGLYERLRRLDEVQQHLPPELRADVDRKVDQLTAVEEPAVDAREKEFVRAVRAYEQHLGLAPPHPEVVFMPQPPEFPGLQAKWEEEHHRYEVNPEVAADPALAMDKVTALMARFMARHFERCAPQIAQRYQFWNEFRLSVVDFVVMTEPDTDYVSRFDFPLLHALQQVGDEAGVMAARTLALRLLDRFDCDWDPTNLPDRIAAVAADAGVPEDVVRHVFAGAPTTRTGATAGRRPA